MNNYRITTLIFGHDNTADQIEKSVKSASETSQKVVFLDDASPNLPNLLNRVQLPANTIVSANQYKMGHYQNFINAAGRYWAETDIFNLLFCPNFDLPNKTEKALEIFDTLPEVSVVYTDSKSQLMNNPAKSNKMYQSYHKFRLSPNSVNKNFLFKKKDVPLQEVEGYDPFLSLIARLTDDSTIAYHLSMPLVCERL